jgi:(+)-neomenthol dehydrogenase
MFVCPYIQQFIGLDFHQRLEWMFKNINETIDGAKEGVKTNFYGTKHVIEALLPLLLQSSSEGKIVNVSSDAGLLTASSDHQSCYIVIPEISPTP